MALLAAPSSSSSSDPPPAALVSPQTALELLVDTNEQTHYAERGVDLRAELARLTGLVARVATLGVGDLALVAAAAPGADAQDLAARRCYLLIERKTHGDLEASIVDGRYQSQRFRLAATGVPAVVWLVVPGPLHDPDSRQRVLTAMYHLAVAWPRTSLVHLPDAELGTAAHAIRALADGVHSAYICETATTAVPSLREAQTRGAKPRFEEQREVYLEQLTVPRGMSVRKAEAVAAVAPNMPTLLGLWRDAASRAEPAYAAVPRSRKRPKTAAELADEALADVELPAAKEGGRPQRLGAVLSKRLRATIAPDLDYL